MALEQTAQLVRMAMRSLVRRPVRSALTMLGLTIGVGTLIAMMSFGEGAKQAVIAQFSQLGTNIVRVLPENDSARTAGRAPRDLDARDVETLRRDVVDALLVVPEAHRRAVVSTPSGASLTTWLRGTTPDYLTIHHRTVALGGAFDRMDQLSRAKICIFGVTPARLLFGAQNPVGQVATIDDRISCTIVGVFAEKGLSTSGRDMDDTIVIPLPTYEAFFGLPNGYSSIEIEARSEGALDAVRADAAAAMDRAHAIRETDPRDFRVATTMDAVEAVRDASSVIARLLAVLAIVSLLVGGIGIMNIQLVSVAERTAEIGIRSALGASPAQILGQFVIESVVLSLTGVLAGIVLGVGVAVVGATLMHWPRAVTFGQVALSAAFGLGIGIAFGYLPAKRASDLEPIDALRRE